MKLGSLVNLTPDIDEKLKKLKEIGLSTCQLCCWDESLFTDEMAAKVNAACAKHAVEVTGFWCGWGGPKAWNFTEGPLTLGLVPVTYRYDRIKTLMRGSDFAKKIGVVDVITHVGFLPENPTDAEYPGLIVALRYLAQYIKAQGQNFLFETGQESPVTLLRVIEDIGTGNLGVNLDTANLILYGKANPVDSLDVFGQYVRGVHAKDGVYPVNGRELGQETAIGQGKVDFAKVIARLKELGYTGAITIEREISGDQQVKDILAAKAILEKLIKG